MNQKLILVKIVLNIFFILSISSFPDEDFMMIPKNLDVEPDYRLPFDVTPSEYNLTLRPYLRPEDGINQFTFYGEIFINITAHISSVNEIILHSQRLVYSLMEYWDIEKPNDLLKFSEEIKDPITNTLKLKLKEKLGLKKNYTLHFRFVGSMEDDMVGFYRSSYIDSNQNIKWLGATQFQKDFARRVFPCFDEPKFKATFDIALIRHKNFKTVSNTRIMTSKMIDKNTYIDIYERTVRMSTYLVAVLISDFNERTNGDFSVVARPEYYHQTNYSFNIGQEILKEFNEYFQLPYDTLGIDKMQMAAIPDFSAGAMENWGLILYRERGLLFEEGSSTQSVKQSITVTIAHEQAHMWFGNLVTCDWWTFTWLNEGFATYFGYMMTSKVYPNWEIDKQFVIDQLQTVLRIDSTNKTRPMSSTSVNEMHTRITYNKAASIIRMVRHAMGEDNFQKSLQDYLIENKYDNVVPDKLLKHWEKNWPIEFQKYAKPLFESFTTQVGYPLITINISSDGKSMEIHQERFLTNSADGSNNLLLYTLPFTFTTNLDKNFTSTKPIIYLEETRNKITIDLPEVFWVIANIQQTGFYRVNYDIRNWNRIHHTLMEDNWGGIHELNRAQFIDDLFNLARSEYISYNLTLNCLKYLKTEINYLPWTAALNGYNYLAIRLGITQKQIFSKYILYQMDKVLKYLDFNEKENDTILEIYNRNNIITWSCKYGNQDCIKNALNLFKKMNEIPISVNIRSAIYCTAMRETNDEKIFNELYEKFKIETVATEQTLIINSLGCVKDLKLIEKYFFIILNDTIRRQDKLAALNSLHSSNVENITPLFKLITENCDILADSLGSYNSVAVLIEDISEKFTTNEQLQDLQHYYDENKQKFGSSAAILKNSIEIVKENLNWSSKHLNEIIEFLNAHDSSMSSLLTNQLKYISLIFPVFICLLKIFG